MEIKVEMKRAEMMMLHPWATTTDTTMTKKAADVPLIVVAPTFYPNTEDIRYGLGLKICREAVIRKVRLIVVDASPHAFVRSEFVAQGTSSSGEAFVRVCRQTSEGRKGAALREAISLAYEELGGKEGFIAFQEPEKVGMVQFWTSIVGEMKENEAGICVPRREDRMFKESYPIEQYHSEHFANLYLDSLAIRCDFPSIDWTMGPVVFHSRYVHHWLDFRGDLWDAQLIPMIKAFKADGATVMSKEVDYQQPMEMKAEEEGAPKWSEKRLMQLNFLFEKIGSELKSE